MNVRIITASAGTGKTTRLAELLDQAISDGSARPEAILATTFTKQAAAELQNRARTRLCSSGRGKAAQALMTARIGTVNAVCGGLVTDFAFELGLSPELRVLDEAGAALELERALAAVVTEEESDHLESFAGKFDRSFDWHFEVQRLIEAARANGLGPEGLRGSSERSVASLDECLGPVAGEAAALDGVLRAAIDGALSAIDTNVDGTGLTKKYCEALAKCRRELARGRLRWGEWASLSHEEPGATSRAHARAVQAAAAGHLAHPRLRDEMRDLVRLMFAVAARGLEEFQAHKRRRGLLDFVDQEVLALDLLSRPELREIVREQLDLVLVDEFQDTSPLQLAIFLKLAELARESVWVGDPKQAIYGFRGTDPALMDAAVESLANPTRDPDLVEAAVAAMAQHRVETLSLSRRSRPGLVAVTNAVFTRAFALQQGMADERVRIDPARDDAPALGPVVAHWPLGGTQRNKEALAEAVACGARDLLGQRPQVCDRHDGTLRPAIGADLAILCRTNEQCRLVSESLGRRGIPSVVARVGLLETAEAKVLLAALALWVDPRDRLAAATLVRLLEYPQDAAAFVAEALDDATSWQERPAIAALLAARQRVQDADVTGALDAATDALELRRLCAGWGDAVQRVANLDALRAHAVRYCGERAAGGDAPTLVGFLAYLDGLVAPGPWGGQRREDTTARASSRDAVTVSTWHAAKGLEWPLVILYGLEGTRQARAYGVHVLTDRKGFDVSDPLGGRWIHFWPNPYTTSNQNGPVQDAYRRSAAFQRIDQQAQREALRVLYVGWTRARDRLVLAAREGKLLDGLLGTLTDIEAGLIAEPTGPAGDVQATWAGHAFTLHRSPVIPTPAEPPPPTPGQVRVGRPPAAYAVATLAPSSAPPRPGRLGEPVVLGDPTRLLGAVEADALGEAVHDFLAADGPAMDPGGRVAMAAGLLERYGVGGALAAGRLVELADRLWAWVRARFGEGCVVRPEWPVGVRLPGGTLAPGAADLVVEGEGAVAIIDHKSFGLTTARRSVEALAAQLGCYADAAARARPGKRVTTWVHLPLEGVMMEVGVG